MDYSGKLAMLFSSAGAEAPLLYEDSSDSGSGACFTTI